VQSAIAAAGQLACAYLWTGPDCINPGASLWGLVHPCGAWCIPVGPGASS
jgi:hypothetical protein